MILRPIAKITDFASEFQAMLDYRKERPRLTRKAIRQKYQLLYRTLVTNEAKLIVLSREFIGYSEAETRAICLEPFYAYYRQCLKALSPKRYRVSSRYSVFAATYPIYQLKTSQGMLLVEIGGLNPIFYLLATLCSAVLYANTVVFYIRGYPEQFAGVLRQICEIVFDQREIRCLSESQISLASLKKHPFNQSYSFLDKVQLKTKPIAKVGSEDRFHFIIVDKSCLLKEAVNEIFYANALNAGRSVHSPDLVFVHAKIYSELKDRLLNVARSPAQAHNTDSFSAKEYFAHAEKCLKYFEKRDYRILNPQACINKNPIILRFPPVLLEKLNLKDYADSHLKERLLNPILPLIRYEDLNPVLEFLLAHNYRYKLSIFSEQTKLINQIIQISDGDLYYLNDIFTSAIPRISAFPLSYEEHSVHALVNHKYVIIKRHNHFTGKLLSPPLLTVQEKCLRFNALMRKVKQKL